MQDRERIAAVALRLLARREHCRLEMEHKLELRNLDPGLVREVLDEFEGRGWLDDGRFADMFARSRIEAGYGPLRIRAELAQRGIGEDPQVVLETDEEQWQCQCRALHDRRYGDAQSKDSRERLRRMRFLQRRGFTGSQIAYAVGGRPDEIIGS